jgi:HEAT repeat protein
MAAATIQRKRPGGFNKPGLPTAGGRKFSYPFFRPCHPPTVAVGAFFSYRFPRETGIITEPGPLTALGENRNLASYYREIVIIIIAGIIVSILGFLLAAVSRRILNARKYSALDEYRAFYRRKISGALQSGRAADLAKDLRSRPLSLEWRAIEEVLFEQITANAHEADIKRLFVQLGYRDHYERKLKSRRTITKAAAADKLGKMRSESSSAGLIKMLKAEDHSEILTVTVRALCRIGGQEGLAAILERLPELYRRSLVSQKTVEASLTNFSADAVPLIVGYASKSDDARIKASLLEVLSHLPATPLSLAYASANLSAPDAEVRARAIRVFGRHDAAADAFSPGLLLPLLEDPVWFVRLQAARALESLRHEKAVNELGVLLLDPNWQVRNASARALARFGHASLDVFLNCLQDRDQYAKESICEEAERTDFTQSLITNLGSGDRGIYEKSRTILRIMHSLNFSTPLHDYLKNGGKEAIKREIALLLQETSFSRRA